MKWFEDASVIMYKYLQLHNNLHKKNKNKSYIRAEFKKITIYRLRLFYSWKLFSNTFLFHLTSESIFRPLNSTYFSCWFYNLKIKFYIFWIFSNKSFLTNFQSYFSILQLFRLPERCICSHNTLYS